MSKNVKEKEKRTDLKDKFEVKLHAKRCVKSKYASLYRGRGRKMIFWRGGGVRECGFRTIMYIQ